MRTSENKTSANVVTSEFSWIVLVTSIGSNRAVFEASADPDGQIVRHNVVRLGAILQVIAEKIMRGSKRKKKGSHRTRVPRSSWPHCLTQWHHWCRER